MSGLAEPDTSRPTVLVRSGWQTVNIGDVAHMPGTVRTWQTYAPDARLVLWPRQVDQREQAMLSRAFPDLEIVHGVLDHQGRPNTPELARAWDSASMLLHGPAGAMVEHEILVPWARTGRPYGYFGVTADPAAPWVGGTLDELATIVDALPAGHLDEASADLVSGAAFFHARDSLTHAYLQHQVPQAMLDLCGVDATFAFDVRDDERAEATCAELGLTPGGFVCVVPRIRYAPYHLLRGYPPAATDKMREAISKAYLPADLGVLVETIERIVRTTGQQVLICPEMRHAVELAREQVLPRVSDAVRRQVRVMPKYWAVEHAFSVYERASAVVSMECHSSILALVHGVPTVYLRLPTETVKGRMFADLGAAGVVAEIGPDAAERVVAELETAWRNQPAEPGPGPAHRRAHELLQQMTEQAYAAAVGASG